MMPARRSAGLVIVLIAPLVSWAVLAAVGYHPTLRAAGVAGLRAMFVGQGLVAGVVYLTLLPILSHTRGLPPAMRLQNLLQVAALRFGLTLLAAGGLAWGDVFSPAPLLVWVGVTYVVMIQFETIALVRWMRLEETR
jgi:hypothetical protein